MEQIEPNQFDALAIGCALLGSGGGGDPAYELLMAKHFIRNPVHLIQIEDLADDCRLLSAAFMGAPIVIKEKVQTGREFVALYEAFKKRFETEPTAVVASEIGGSNGITPLLAAANLGLPLLNADGMGRAFPQLQMTTPHLHGISASPAFFSDCKGNCGVLETESTAELEHLGRHLAVAMGTACAVSIYPLTGAQAKGCLIPNSYTHAIRLGQAVLTARSKGIDPVAKILEVSDGALLANGVIVDIDQRVDRGFLEGSVTVQVNNSKVAIHYQNEYLVVESAEGVLATTPDIIAIVDQETGSPLTSEILRYGLRVAVIALPSPKAWTTPRGLSLVGPRYFGYPYDYNPVQVRKAS